MGSAVDTLYNYTPDTSNTDDDLLRRRLKEVYGEEFQAAAQPEPQPSEQDTPQPNIVPNQLAASHAQAPATPQDVAQAPPTLGGAVNQALKMVGDVTAAPPGTEYVGPVETALGVGRMLSMAPEALELAGRRTVKSWKPSYLNEKTENDLKIDELSGKLESFTKTADKSKMYFPGVDEQDVYGVSGSLGFTGLTMAAGITARVAGGALGGVAGERAGNYLGKGAQALAAGVEAFHLDKAQFADDYMKRLDAETVALKGRHLTKDEWNAALDKIEPDADRHAYHEAGWEALAAVPEFEFVRGNVVKTIGKIPGAGSLAGILEKVAVPFATEAVDGIVTKAGKAVARGAGRIGAVTAMEAITEIPTTKYQGRVEAEVGMRPKEPTWVEAVKETLPQVFVQSAVMGGAGQVASKAYDMTLGRKAAEQSAENLKTGGFEEARGTLVDQLASGAVTSDYALSEEGLAQSGLPREQVLSAVNEAAAMQATQGEPRIQEDTEDVGGGTPLPATVLEEQVATPVQAASPEAAPAVVSQEEPVASPTHANDTVPQAPEVKIADPAQDVEPGGEIETKYLGRNKAIGHLTNRQAVTEQLLEGTTPEARERLKTRITDHLLGEHGAVKFADIDETIHDLHAAGIPYVYGRVDGGNIGGLNKQKGNHADADEEIRAVWGKEYVAQARKYGAVIARDQGDEFKEIWPNYTKAEVGEIRADIEKNIRAKLVERGLGDLVHHKLDLPTGSLYTSYGHVDGSITPDGKPAFGEMDREADLLQAETKEEYEVAQAEKHGYIKDETTGKYVKKEEVPDEPGIVQQEARPAEGSGGQGNAGVHNQDESRPGNGGEGEGDIKATGSINNSSEEVAPTGANQDNNTPDASDVSAPAGVTSSADLPGADTAPSPSDTAESATPQGAIEAQPSQPGESATTTSGESPQGAEPVNTTAPASSPDDTGHTTSRVTRPSILHHETAEASTPSYGATNKLVTVDRAEELRRRLREKLNNINAGIDPELMALGTELAVFHVEAGARAFSQFSQTMIADLGEKARPYLKSWYMGAKMWPGMDKTGMDTEETLNAQTDKTDTVAAVPETNEVAPADQGRREGDAGGVPGAAAGGVDGKTLEERADKPEDDAQAEDVTGLDAKEEEEPVTDLDNTGKGSTTKPRLTPEERAAKKAEREAKKKAAEGKKQKKANLGNFQNIGYVYDPEKLRDKVKNSSPKSAVKVILDAMVPSKIWGSVLSEEANPGAKRVAKVIQDQFATFKDYIINGDLGRASGRTSDTARIEAAYGKDADTISSLMAIADEYMERLKPVIDSMAGQTDITGMIGRLQDALLPGQRTADGSFSENYSDLQGESPTFPNRYLRSVSKNAVYGFLTQGWTNYLEDEHDILLSEVDPHKRSRNSSVIRDGLPEYNAELKKTEDFNAPFQFKGVGFGEQNWINQEERNRVIPAAFNAFKDLAATIGANNAGMSLGGQLAVQFANLGHLAKGAAAAYFPTKQTINFTRDQGDGTLSHEWGHALHYLSGQKVIGEIDQAVQEMRYSYDFEAGARYVDDLLAKDSHALKRIIDSKKQSRIELVKQLVAENFAGKVRQETDYYKTSQDLDKEYTAQKTEMWARGFEAYVYDNLGGTNNYLVNDFVGEGRVGGKAYQSLSLVYPAGAERSHINGIIKHILDGLQWDGSGAPQLKDDYVTLEANREALLQEELAKLLDQVEARYNAIWASDTSEDGNYWYSYDATSFGPMMQPDGHVAYDKEYKGEEQGGTGAAAFSHQLHPDEILDFGLTNIYYEGGGAKYIATDTGGITDEIRGDGEETLDGVSAGENGGSQGSGPVRDGDQGSGGPSAGRGGDNDQQGDEEGFGSGDSGEGISPVAPGNYRITDDALTDPKSVDARFAANLAAVKLLKQIEGADRQATPDEKEILAQYSGWGGIGEAFSWSPSGVWVRRAELLNDVLDYSEKDSAAASSPSSYYTPVPVARFMWQLAQRLGFERGAVLDPATGANGIFLGTMPADLDMATSLHGVEKDSLSARMAVKLYEVSNIEEKGFQDSKRPMNRFDLTITNVPFESVSPADPKHNKGRFPLHNYYINKMLDLTAPGALSMMITSSATMDKEGDHLTEYAAKADFVGAIRLPSGIYSGTAVTTDILVFRKKIEGGKFVGIPQEGWTSTGQDESTGLTINKYFLDHPDMVAGNLEAITGRFGNEAVRVVNNEDLTERLARIADAFPGNIVEREAVKEVRSIGDIIPAPGTVKEGGLYINAKGAVAWKQDGEEIVMPTATAAEQKAAKIAGGYVGILDQVRTVLRDQRGGSSADIVKASQAALKKKYDAFVKAYGPVNSQKNAKIFVEDPDSSWVLALEEYDPDTDKVTKLADLFTKKVAGMDARPTTADTDHDALAMSLDEYGYPNLEYMARLRGTDTDAVLKGVMDKVVENPETGFLETMEEYLSGPVKRKLAIAREMAAEHSEYERNVKLLEAAQPEDIPPHRITARIGASWIHPDHLGDFMAEKLNINKNRLSPVFSLSPVTNEWAMSFGGRETWKGENKAETQRSVSHYAGSVEATKVWGTKRMGFFELMKHALAGKRPVITYVGEDKKVHLDVVATQAAEAKLRDIQGEFGRWLFSEPEMAAAAAQRFNDLINVSVPPKYSGEHLTFPGKSMAVLTPGERDKIGIGNAVAFYPHQMDATWKYLRAGNQYLAHEVGAGKTITMALIAMEARRLRGKKRVVYVTMNDSTMGQAVAEIKRLYPLANLLPVRVSTNEQRKRLQLQKLAMNEFDVAIMRQQDLDRIALSPDAEKVFIDQEIYELREVLEEAKRNGARLHERDIQQRINSLEEKLKAGGVHKEAKDKNMYFDDIGVDLLIVDESHAYKNVPYATRLTGITGLNPKGSSTAQAFFRKTQYLNAQFPKGGGIVLASGTPLTNSIAEMYNIQRMLQPADLKRQGLWNFDRWIATYGDIGSQLEWDGARGKYKNIVTNRKIVNAGRLLAMAYRNVDSVRAKDTPIVRPEIKGGEPNGISVQQNQYVEEYTQIILDRARALERNPKDSMFEGTPDNMLRIISNMSKVAIDQRLDPRYANTEIQEDSKIFKASRLIFKRWQEEKAHKGVQIVFSDLGVPKRFVNSFKEKSEADIEKMTDEQLAEYQEAKYEAENASAGFNVYDGLTAELVKLGIPRDQIAYIHDADHSNKAKKEASLRGLFKKVNAGTIRVFIGSTSKAGTGVNVQERVSDIHHLDIWWNYSAWEQRNGRGIRAGNIYRDLGGVGIHNYVTEGTVDATRWDKVFAKDKVLNAVMGGDVNLDIIEDISDATMSAKQMAAIASGDPLMAEQADLFQKVQGLKYEQSSFLDTVRMAKQELAKTPSEITAATARAEKHEKSGEIMGAVTAVKFVGGDKVFVLAKDGKEISAALEKAVAKDMAGWDKDKKAPLLVFGTHAEKETAGKEKQKEYAFSPVPVKAEIMGSPGDPMGRRIFLSGAKVDSASKLLADIDKKKKTVDLHANLSRVVTEYVTAQKSFAEREREKIQDFQDNAPKLQAVVESPWAKKGELDAAEKKLREVEAKMAEAGQGVAGSPETGMPIEAYKGVVPVMDDVAPRGDWSSHAGVIVPSSRELAFRKDREELAKLFENTRKDFKPYVDNYSQAGEAYKSILDNPGKVVYAPKAFTTIDSETRLWVSDGKYVKPESWQLAQRVVGKAGKWTYGKSEGYRGTTEYLIHIPDGAEVGDALITLQSGDMPDGVGTLLEGNGSIVGNETGRAFILEDAVQAIGKAADYVQATASLQAVAEHVYQAGMGFKTFLEKMREAIGEAWDKFKAKALELWQHAKKKFTDQTGAVGPDIETAQKEKIDEILFGLGKKQASPESQMRTTLKEALDSTAHIRPSDVGVIKDLIQSGKELSLAVFSMRQLAEMFAEHLPQITEYAGVVKAISAMKNLLMSEADAVHGKWSRLPEATRASLARVMHNATIMEMHPDREYIPADPVRPLDKIKHLIVTRQDELAAVSEGRKEVGTDKEEREYLTLYFKAERKAELTEEEQAKLDGDTARFATSGTPDTLNKYNRIKRNLLNLLAEEVEEKARAERFPRLKEEYDNLPQEARDVYREVRALYDKRFQQLKEALEARISEVYKDNEESRGAGMAKVRSMFDRALGSGPYFPLARFGKYGVNATMEKSEAHPDGERVFSKFDSYSAAQRFVAEMKDKGYTTSLSKDKPFDSRLDGAPNEFAASLVNYINESKGIDNGAKNGLIDEINQMMISALPDLAYRKHFKHRKKTEGYSTDAMRAFASSMFHGAQHIARVKYSHQLESLYREMDGVASRISMDDPTEQAKEQAIVDAVAGEIKKRHQDLMNPQTSPIAQAATALGFIWNIGPSVASGMVNLTQTAVVTAPYLAGRFGHDKAFASLGKAYADMAKGAKNWRSGFDMSLEADANNHLTPEERQALRELADDGFIDVTQAHALAAASGADSLLLGKGGRQQQVIFMRAVSYPFHVAEVINRQVSALSAFRLAKGAGMSYQAAKEFAGKTVDDTHFDYSRENRPRIMQGDVARVVLLFKQYSQNMAYILGRSFHQAIKGADEQTKHIARVQLMGTLGTTFLLSGLMGMPVLGGAMFFFEALANALGDDDKPWDWKKALLNTLADIGGPGFTEVAAHGPARLTGIDIAARTGLSDLLFREPDKVSEGRAAWTEYLNMALGPLAQNIGNLFSGASAVSEGEVWRGVELMVPKFIKDGMKAMRYASEGVKTWKQEQLIESLGAAEILSQFLGFSPASVARLQEKRAIVKRDEDSASNRRDLLVNRHTNAVRGGDTVEQKEAMNDIIKFNKTNPLYAIKLQSLISSVKSREKVEALTEEGVYLPKNKQGLRKEYRF